MAYSVTNESLPELMGLSLTRLQARSKMKPCAESREQKHMHSLRDTRLFTTVTGDESLSATHVPSPPP